MAIVNQVMKTPLYWFQDENPLKVTNICEDDNYPIFLLENFLNEEECKWIINTYSGQLKPSTTIKDGMLIVNTNRTSTTAHLTESGKESKDSVLYSIQIKVAALYGTSINNIESINLTHYFKNEEFLPHYDYFDISNPKNIERMGQAGQRVATFLIYLNTVKEQDGGKTTFVDLSPLLSVQPKMGSCLSWFNTSADGTVVHLQSRHTGEKLLDGEKWALNVWVRQSAF